MYANFLRERAEQVRPAVVYLIGAIGICFYASPLLFAMANRLAG